MKLELATWPDGSKAAEFDESSESLELVKELYGFPDAVKVNLMVHKANNEVIIEGRLHTAGYTRCVRCLEEFKISVDESFRRVASIVPDKQVQPDSGDPDFTFLPESLPDWDLADPVREMITLVLPDNPVCSEACRGLCPTCGANLNQESCNCSGAAGRNSMAQLGDLLSRRPNSNN